MSNLPSWPLMFLGEGVTAAHINAARTWCLAAFGVSELFITPNAATPATKRDIACARALLIGGGGSYALAEDVNLTLDFGTTGPLGLDTGSLAQGIYHIWLIGKDQDEEAYDGAAQGASYYAAGTSWADGSASFGITDAANDLESLYEATAGASLVLVEATDGAGKKALGFVRGIAKSGNNYTLDVYDDLTGTNQNWMSKESGFNESAATYTFRLLTREGLAESVSAIASTSATDPALPAGYTFKKRIGMVLADATPELVPSDQQMQDFQYLQQCTLTTGAAAVADNDISLASWVPAVALNVKLVAELWTNGISVNDKLEVRAYGETAYLSPLRLNVGDSGEGCANSQPFELPVRSSGGVPYIGYKVTKSGTNSATHTIDVRGLTYPLTAEI